MGPAGLALAPWLLALNARRRVECGFQTTATNTKKSREMLAGLFVLEATFLEFANLYFFASAFCIVVLFGLVIELKTSTSWPFSLMRYF